MTTTELWTIIGASAGIATAVATAVAAAFAIWMRWHDRAQPDWAVTGYWSQARNHFGDSDPKRPPSLIGTITNAGDGPAFKVEVCGRGCEAELNRRLAKASMSGVSAVSESFAAVLQPGESREVWVPDVTKDMFRSAAVILEWTATPTRRRKRKTQRIPLSDFIATEPTIQQLNQQTGQYEDVP
ncbi:hypothetical protein [Knoellia koreensis]|uniref:Uncharacterized protein n=1 Tax=Knoellia koreensis TaxID=2730921 RepID=A0A849HC23_9MICO|nr:hypothetical protein [Knoellia sp. DB2414S]NNM44599.1 hypothetical protein [Knoellia sp. DB2414S]